MMRTIWKRPERSASLPASVISKAFMSGASLKGTVSLGICMTHQAEGHNPKSSRNFKSHCCWSAFGTCATAKDGAAICTR